MPGTTFALPFTSVPAAIVNTFVGLFITAILLVTGVGIVQYIGRLGTYPSNRDEAVVVLEWAVVMLFTLVIVVAVAQFIEREPVWALWILGAFAALFIMWYILKITAFAKEEKKEEKKA